MDQKHPKCIVTSIITKQQPDFTVPPVGATCSVEPTWIEQNGSTHPPELRLVRSTENKCRLLASPKSWSSNIDSNHPLSLLSTEAVGPHVENGGDPIRLR